MAECRTCESFKDYQIQRSLHIIGGCYRKDKWRRWVSKSDYNGPMDCPYYRLKSRDPVASIELETMDLLLGMQQLLMNKAPKGFTPETCDRVTAGLGLIEETLEYLNSTGWKPWRPKPLPREAQLEELVDILFYYMELILLSGIDWSEMVEEYKRKHQENLQRYECGAKGNYSWNHRVERREL